MTIVAKNLQFERYTIPTCPIKYGTAQTDYLFSHPLFLASLRHKELPIAGGGVIDQPVNFSEYVAIARAEIETFRVFKEEASRIKKH